ncbi:MAG: hypothetical protein KBT20_09925 [Bacteroidales bacterium]|nr:hypothetical protein [Candidatus Liminaster caballi]
MKKIFTSFLVAAMALTMNAQVISSPTDVEGVSVGLTAETMSPNALYVVGLDENSGNPTLWKTATGEIAELSESTTVFYYEYTYGQKDEWQYQYDWETWEIIDSVLVQVDDYDNKLDSTLMSYEAAFTGSFLDVNDLGMIVGEYGIEGNAVAILANASDIQDYTMLAAGESETEASSAYAISADGSVIAGFYYDAVDFANSAVKACIWTEGGSVRTDLPWPTNEEIGVEIEGTEARWISADGKIIGGFAQTFAFGDWILLFWELQEDGTYKPNTLVSQYYTENYDPALANKYMKFEPQGFSSNGEWATLMIQEQFDMFDWDAVWPDPQAARLNLKTGVMEVLTLEADPDSFFAPDAPTLYSVADNGTAVGFTGGMMTVRKGFVWPAGSSSLVAVKDIFTNEKYFDYTEMDGEESLSYITPDAKKVLGMNHRIVDEEWLTSSFIAELPETLAIENVGSAKAEVPAVCYDLMGNRVDALRSGFMIVGGKKVLVK